MGADATIKLYAEKYLPRVERHEAVSFWPNETNHLSIDYAAALCYLMATIKNPALLPIAFIFYDTVLRICA